MPRPLIQLHWGGVRGTDPANTREGRLLQSVGFLQQLLANPLDPPPTTGCLYLCFVHF